MALYGLDFWEWLKKICRLGKIKKYYGVERKNILTDNIYLYKTMTVYDSKGGF